MTVARGHRALLVGLLLVVAGCADSPSTPPSPAQSGAASAEASVDVVSPSPESSPSASPEASPSPEPSPSPSPAQSPAITTKDRINVLLLGVDNGPDRAASLRTDVIMVASIDPVRQTASFLSVPRDIVDMPLANGQRYRSKINGLVADAKRSPGRYPGGSNGGEAALASALETLLGIDIPYWASVDFTGFEKIVKAAGGVDVFAFRGLCDTGYRDDGFRGFELPKGTWHLDPEAALAYARIRHPLPESDFTRTIRQVQLLMGLRSSIVGAGLDVDPVKALEALGVVRTNVPDGVLDQLAALAPSITDDRVYRKTLWPPDYVVEGSDARGYILTLKRPAITELVGQLFPPAGGRVRTGDVSQYVSDATARDFTGTRATC